MPSPGQVRSVRNPAGAVSSAEPRQAPQPCLRSSERTNAVSRHQIGFIFASPKLLLLGQAGLVSVRCDLATPLRWSTGRRLGDLLALLLLVSAPGAVFTFAYTWLKSKSCIVPLAQRQVWLDAVAGMLHCFESDPAQRPRPLAPSALM